MKRKKILLILMALYFAFGVVAGAMCYRQETVGFIGIDFLDKQISKKSDEVATESDADKGKTEDASKESKDTDKAETDAKESKDKDDTETATDESLGADTTDNEKEQNTSGDEETSDNEEMLDNPETTNVSAGDGSTTNDGAANDTSDGTLSGETNDVSNTTASADVKCLATVTGTDSVYIRDAADTNSNVIGRVRSGNTAEVLEIGEYWHYIRCNGIEGYASASYLELTEIQ